ncbi:sensor histidine kinase [Labrys wisconsinensis]|uniref:histidine kinase n=1 Tax=Labrys wisconsinensis TaxID=425677 RepID=A0ABU0IYM6_9HYPH|nr:ATP-binding protein [Labrys wisconsinensis]MDQ0467104.1 signal transduction histidine kinase [Labrys wisconsinensis]
MRSLRAKLSAFIGGVALLTVLAAAGILFAVRVSDRTLERVSQSQHRLDLLTEVSGRITDYGLAAIDTANAGADGASRLADLDVRARAVAIAIEAAQASDAVGEQAPSRGRLLAHLRGDFDILTAQVSRAMAAENAEARGDIIRGALNGFGTTAGPNLSQLVEGERRFLQGARDEARQSSRRLTIGAIVAAALALAAALVLHRTITQPLLRRLAAMEHAAAAIGRGELETRLDVATHDELGLLMARFNRMATRLARRTRRLDEDRAALEGTVTERTADLTAANERLAAIDNSRRRFFADVSHELRTPLTVVLGECDVTLRAPAIPETEARSVLATIRQRALALHRRVEDMLRVARSESGEIELSPAPVPLRPILVEAVDAFATPARRRGVALRLDAAEIDVDIEADRDWLRQIVEGLIDNALRHAAGARTIVVAMETTPATARILVSDDGAGMDPAVRERAFERFARPFSKAAEPGFGIGLSLAHWIIARHHGHIAIDSSENGAAGTRIVIELPKK